MTDLELLARRIRSTAIQNAILALLSSAVGMSVLAAAWMGHAPLSKRGLVGAFGALFVWVGWIMLSSARRLWPARRSRVYRALAEDGHDIAWAHLTTGALRAITIYFDDGQMVILYASRKKGERLLQLVQQMVPQATIGFSDEAQAAYHARLKSSRRG
jgi:hypothetical protein